jgi:uncharacterized protein (DUF1697 family)
LNTYAVFLRSINVGRHNRIKMADLLRVVSGLGYEQPSTYLQSGNVILRSDQSPEQVTQALDAALVDHGLVNASSFVRTEEQMQEIVKLATFEPFPNEQYGRFVIFTRGKPIPLLEGPMEWREAVFLASSGPDLLGVIPKNLPRPLNIGPFVDKEWGVVSTVRFWNVVQAFTALAW